VATPRSLGQRARCLTTCACSGPCSDAYSRETERQKSIGCCYTVDHVFLFSRRVLNRLLHRHAGKMLVGARSG